MTCFNHISLGFAALLLLGLLCNARPVVEKRGLGVQEVFDERSDSQDVTLSTPVFNRSHTIIADHWRVWSTGSRRACPAASSETETREKPGIQGESPREQEGPWNREENPGPPGEESARNFN